MLAVFHNFDNVLYVKEVPMPVRADQQIMVKISYCCLGDVKYFLRVFKKAVGVSPSGYRAMQKAR